MVIHSFKIDTAKTKFNRISIRISNEKKIYFIFDIVIIHLNDVHDKSNISVEIFSSRTLLQKKLVS